MMVQLMSNVINRAKITPFLVNTGNFHKLHELFKEKESTF